MSTDYLSLINGDGHSEILIDAEQPIIVNGFSRECEIFDNFNKQVGVAGDHRCNKITFWCDRYIDGHDVGACAMAFIKWQNLGSGASGAYVIEDRKILESDESRIEFHWIPESDCTTTAGILKFQICFLDYDESGTKTTYCWNSSLNSDLSIGEGIFNSNINDLKPNDTGSFIYSGAISIT